MAGIEKYRFVQLGKETVAGTEVNATVIWRNGGVIQDETEVQFVEENVGYISGTDRTMITKVGGVLELDEGPASYEQLPYLLQGAIDEVAGAADGAGTGYIYTYTFPTTASSTADPCTYTVEAGDNEQEEQFLYGFVDSISLSGVAGEALNMGGTIRGRQVATGTKTAALSLTAVEGILFSKGKLYIDGATTAFGTTLKSNTLLEASIDIKSGWVPVFTADGALYYSFIKNVGPEITMDITFEHETTSIAEKAAWRAETPRNIRLKFEGSAVTPGTTYSYKTLIIDLTGKWESFEALDSKDGNDTVTGTFRARYDPDANHFAKIIVVNTLSALP